MADHYFTAKPSAPSRPQPVELCLPDMQLTLMADRGVFSGSRVDPGTLCLLKESPHPPAAGDLLDLGCGYGPIACALARRSPGATVWAVDVNSRALELTAANAASLGMPNLRAAGPDEVPTGVVFKGIWSNPPIKVGKDALHELLSTWLDRLGTGAGAWLVVNRHLGSDSLAEWLAMNGWAVRRAASKSGYRVLEVTR
ncbi:MAG TPA: methyltransferase [Acidimicrobiales bacterium]|nr:methyltransferase [Acidimicrobiales bacterium]